MYYMFTNHAYSENATLWFRYESAIDGWYAIIITAV